MPRAISVLIALALLTPAAPHARQDASEPASVKEVMTAMTIPASDVIFDAASRPPESDAAWAAVSKAADTLAASGRLLTTSRLARDTTTWMEMARALVSQAEATRTVADAKARDRLEPASDTVYATCEGCHERYLQP